MYIFERSLARTFWTVVYFYLYLNFNKRRVLSIYMYLKLFENFF